MVPSSPAALDIALAATPLHQVESCLTVLPSVSKICVVLIGEHVGHIPVLSFQGMLCVLAVYWCDKTP